MPTINRFILILTLNGDYTQCGQFLFANLSANQKRLCNCTVRETIATILKTQHVSHIWTVCRRLKLWNDWWLHICCHLLNMEDGGKGCVCAVIRSSDCSAGSHKSRAVRGLLMDQIHHTGPLWASIRLLPFVDDNDTAHSTVVPLIKQQGDVKPKSLQSKKCNKIWYSNWF